MKLGVALALTAVGVSCLLLAGCGGGDGGSPAGGSPAAISPRLTRQPPAVVVGDCRLAAKALSHGVVYCPPLVPKGPVYSQSRSSRGRVSIDAGGDEYTLNFVSSDLAGFDPKQAKGRRHHLGHWLIAAYDERGQLEDGPEVESLTRRKIAGVTVTVLDRRSVAYNLDAGHVVAFWSFRGRTFELSLHGFENRPQVEEMAGAAIAQMHSCAPAGGAIPDRSACRLVFAAG